MPGPTALLARTGGRVAVAAILLCLALPTLIIIPMSFSGETCLAFPPQSWSLGWYRQVIYCRAWFDAAGNSLLIGAGAALLATGLGTHVGGTFTDMLVVDAASGLAAFKVPTDTADPARGVMQALERAAASCGQTVRVLLGRCSLFVHGTTIATNTLLEHKGARLGCLVTEGFRDSLEIRRGIRPNLWDHRSPYPPVLVPRCLRLPVRGRIGHDGAELVPLCQPDVAVAAEVFAQEGVEAIAVCLFNSYLNPTHEARARDVRTLGS